MEKKRYLAHFWNHEIQQFDTCHVQSDDNFERTADDTFRVYGDRLAWLKDEGGKLVYDNSEEAVKYALDNLDWEKP